MPFHTRNLKAALTFSLLSLATLPAAGQYPVRGQLSQPQDCTTRLGGCAPVGATFLKSSRPPAIPPPTMTVSQYDFDFPEGSMIEVHPSAGTAPRRAQAAEPKESVQQQDPRANPDAPDQSELLKNSKDHDFILRNLKTVYIETRDIDLFGPAQIKAELGKNRDFQKLNIHFVDDRRVADAVLVVGYTFAWDYPFELRHQNTTMVLLSGKGEGPLSGPLGAWDVARQFVNAVKPWRTPQEQKK